MNQQFFSIRLPVLLFLLFPLAGCGNSVSNPQALHHVRKAAFALGQQDPSTARRHFELALMFQPENVDALAGLGAILFLEGERTKARWFLEKALRQGGNHPETHANLGVLYWSKGRPKKAMAHFQTALYLDPGNNAARWNTAMLFLEQQNYREAARHLGWYCTRNDYPEEAVKLWKHVLDAARKQH